MMATYAALWFAEVEYSINSQKDWNCFNLFNMCVFHQKQKTDTDISEFGRVEYYGKKVCSGYLGACHKKQ